VTSKNATAVISRTSYTGAAYTHQGWVNNPAWQEFLVADDEYDEVNRTAPGEPGKATTYFWDIRSLENPKQTGSFQSAVTSIDHNQYVADGLSFQSNYGAGLRVIDISSLNLDATGRSVREVAHFDIYPEDDSRPGGGAVSFTGTWANYPYFKSGFILINTMERGAFVVKQTNRKALR
jgi:choice-of-anchor B domain-containing protein